MPGVRPGDRAGLRVPRRDESGGGLVGFEMAEHAVDPGENPAGEGSSEANPRMALRISLITAAARRPCPATSPTPRKITALDGERVVPVAAHRRVARRKVHGGHLQALARGGDGGKQSLLQESCFGPLRRLARVPGCARR